MKYLQYTLCVFALVGWPLQAKATKDMLNVSPKVCVVSEQQPYCDLDLEFKWQLPAATDVCLFQQKTKIQCWKSTQSGQFNYKARVQVETLYSLINPHSGALLASVRVDVQTAFAKKQHRLRSPWSFF